MKYGGAAVVAGQFGGLDADRRGADGNRLRGCLEGHRRRSVYGLEHRQQRQLTSRDPIGVVSGTSTALESLETSFHQDLNGDGVIGVRRATVIEAIGSTSLTEVGNNFYLYNSSGSGPELKYGGAAVVAGQFGGLDADRRGADGKRLRGCLEGRGRRSVYGLEHRQQRQLRLRCDRRCVGKQHALESLETSFHQDLNGDGVIGLAHRR